MEIDELAGRIGALGDEVSGAADRLGRTDPGPEAFAGDASGRLGELGRALHAQWRAALAAREREAAAAGARLTDLAGALRTAADGYRDAEDAAHRRHRRAGAP
ncbi:type VII secretion target [Rugosimonospora africana]|uniref:Excreted virulence factor EspC, type VII ESX diderm n=1 Tax=Rugosimonospora africana TaxID=556532 RepID=A0A8J3QMR5_9ACTN|nr:type VII secretion target [Rugosimonospora africana]GIH12398.1 hypothetical protein Raf01_05700 [Rugosimonospora africana]